MALNTYQLRTQFEQMIGQYYCIDGPFDTHGRIIKSEEKIDDQGRKYYLNTVRGTGNSHYDSI